MLARRLSLLVVLSLSSTAIADRAHPVPDGRGAIPTGAVCSHGENRCFAHVHLNAAGEIRALAVPNGFGPQDLWSAYTINPDITTTPTVAVVDAYGYANLESDLATYRATFGLPACTRANGCLTVMSQRGSTTQLPAESARRRRLDRGDGARRRHGQRGVSALQDPRRPGRRRQQHESVRGAAHGGGRTSRP